MTPSISIIGIFVFDILHNALGTSAWQSTQLMLALEGERMFGGESTRSSDIVV